MAHHIDDFTAPRLPWPVRACNRVAGPLATRLVSFDDDELLATARKRTGLDDFGHDGFREPLAVLTNALRVEARLSPLGRVMARQLIVQLLSTRLRAEDLITCHPEILEEPIHAPIFIVGLPRTGTTHLHNLVSQDPSLRSLPYWESLEPVPPGALPVGDDGTDADDPRRRRCEQALKLQHYLMPLFELMHEMTVDAAHEEIQLLAVDFSTMLFETMYEIPSYRDWYKASNQTSAYRTLRRMLQMLQWIRGPKRWVLKSPQHLEQIGPLLSVFPDARIVQTHRDPLRVLASMITMAAYGLRVQNQPIDPHVTGRYWRDRVEDLLRAAVENRPLIPAGQVMDVRFHEFMGDDVGTAGHVLEFVDQAGGDGARRAIERYMAANPRGKHGTIDYRLDDFGIDADEQRRALRFYQDFFDVPDE